MATLKQRLHRKNSSGGYDTVHLETEWSMITGKPSTYPPDSHTHSGYAATGHKHAAGDITSGTLGVTRGGTGVTSYDDLKLKLGINGGSAESGGSGGSSGSTTPGGSMTFDNLNWIVVDDGTYMSTERILVLKDIWCLMNGYNIERFVTHFWNNVLSAEARAKCIPHTIKEFGTNAKVCPVFVPTYNECNGGFKHFSSNTNRIANYNGTATAWWTSSPGSGGYVYFVNADGDLGHNVSPSNASGFRPCVALKR